MYRTNPGLDEAFASGRRRRSWIGGIAHAVLRKLSGLARRVGAPALATVPVSVVMLSRIHTVTLDQPLEDVVRLLLGGRQTHLPIVDHDRAIGVVTRADVAAALRRVGPSGVVACAPHHDVFTVTPADALDEVRARLRAAPDAIALVVDHGSPVGMLTAADLDAYVKRIT